MNLENFMTPSFLSDQGHLGNSTLITPLETQRLNITRARHLSFKARRHAEKVQMAPNNKK